MVLRHALIPRTCCLGHPAELWRTTSVLQKQRYKQAAEQQRCASVSAASACMAPPPHASRPILLLTQPEGCWIFGWRAHSCCSSIPATARHPTGCCCCRKLYQKDKALLSKRQQQATAAALAAGLDSTGAAKAGMAAAGAMVTLVRGRQQASAAAAAAKAAVAAASAAGKLQADSASDPA